LLDHLARKTGDPGILEALRNATGLERSESLEPLQLAPDVTIVPNSCQKDAPILSAQTRKDLRSEPEDLVCI
jgi:hypothetical protein